MSSSPPLVVADRYRLVAPLGQGGMGRVWRATDVVLHREVAIKELVPPPGLTPGERQEMRERSLREARAIARLNNVNVVRVFDVLRTDADPWIVMEYVPSRSLQDTLAADGPFSAVRTAEIGLGVLNALRAAHRAGVVHRDVKPGNVLIGAEGRVVLTDFGLATVPGDPNVTRTGLVLGSPAYIAPERARDGSAGPAADLWSLGATLYAAVEGASPFARPSAIATLAALATENPPPARNAGPLKPVLNGLLRKDPTHRINAEEAERLLLRATGRRSKLSFPMSPTMRRPGVGRDRSALTGMTGSTPVVPGPRPPVARTGGPTGHTPVLPGPNRPAGPPVTPGRPSGERPPIFAPGKAPVGQTPQAQPPKAQPPKAQPPKAQPPKAQPPKAQPPRLDATRVDGPPVQDDKTTFLRTPPAPTRSDNLSRTSRGAEGGFTAADVAANRRKKAAPEHERSLAEATSLIPRVEPESPAEQKADPTTKIAMPVQQTPVQQTPVQQTPVQQTPVQQTPVQQTPAKQPSAPPEVVSAKAEQAPTVEKSGVEASGTEVHKAEAEKTQAEESLAEATSADATESATPASAEATKAAAPAGKGESKGAEVDSKAVKGESKATTDASTTPAAKDESTAPAAEDESTAPAAEDGSATPADDGESKTSADESDSKAKVDNKAKDDSAPKTAAKTESAAPADQTTKIAGPPADRTTKIADLPADRTTKIAESADRTTKIGAPPRRTVKPAVADATQVVGSPAVKSPSAGINPKAARIGSSEDGRDQEDDPTPIPSFSRPSRPAWTPMPVSQTPGITVFGTRLTYGQAAIGGGILLLVLVLLIVLIGNAVGDDENPSGQSAVVPTASAGGSTPPSAAATSPSQPAASAAPPALNLPANWRIYTDGSGYKIPVPKNASISQGGDGTTIKWDNRFLLIDQTDDPKPDALADWKEQEQSQRGRYRDYDRVKIVSVPNYFKQAADWEFYYTTTSGNRQHAVKRNVITDGHAYSISWYVSPEDWDASQADLKLLYQGFEPKK